MKKIILFFVFLSVLLIGCTEAPDGHDLSGKDFSLSPYKGKWLIVNYWAPWCTPCLKELPILNQLHLAHADKITVIGVSFDELTSAEAKKFSQKLKFPLLKDFAKEKWRIKRIDMLPVTFVFSPDHKLFKVLKGPQSKQSLLQIIKF